MKFQGIAAMFGAIVATFASTATAQDGSTCEANLGDAIAPPDGVTYPPLTNGITGANGFDNNLAFFVGGNFISRIGSEVEGAMVILGDMVVEPSGLNSLVQVGQGSGVFPNGGDILRIGGSVTLERFVSIVAFPGPNGAGTVTHKGPVVGSGSWQIGAGGTIVHDPNLDLTAYSNLMSELDVKSQYYGSLPGNGVFVREAGGYYRLSAGDDECLQVFNFPADFLNGEAFGFVIDLNANLAGKTMIFNVAAFDPTPQEPRRVALVDNIAGFLDTNGNFGIQLDPATGASILWNFPDAEYVEFGNNAIGNGQIAGTLLAPRSDLRYSFPGHQGRVIVGGDLIQERQGTEFHNYPFDPVDTCPLPPLPQCDCPIENNVKFIKQQGQTTWTGELPFEIIEQTGKSVTFKVKHTWATPSIDSYYVYHENGLDADVCALNEDVLTTDEFTYTASCMSCKNTTVVDLFIADDDFDAVADDATIPHCCHPEPEDIARPTVQYTFILHCDDQCVPDSDTPAEAVPSSFRKLRGASA
uniref:Choice-of-anchor A family protein n=1 Tax=Craspedostauros australis TaxID=1486917 RepID=A0A7R9ZQM3_9STRA|nr:Trailin1 [Craspedostauros australis]